MRVAFHPLRDQLHRVVEGAVGRRVVGAVEFGNEEDAHSLTATIDDGGGLYRDGRN